MSYIDGVQVIPRKEITDYRGAIRHGIRIDDKFMQGEEIGEVYFSQVNPTAVKAWHLHKIMTLRYLCVKGSVSVGLYDDREGSPTRGRAQKVLLSDNGLHYRLLVIPPGVWNGFRVYEGYIQAATICNIASHPHDPDEIVRASIEDIPWGLNWGDYTVSG